jgi:hypothetical protein
MPKRKLPLQPEAGEWEPMMLVVSLAIAACMTYLIYGDRISLGSRIGAATAAVSTPAMAAAGHSD